MAVHGTRNWIVLLTVMLLGLHTPLSHGSTHWVVTEEGLITQQVNSEFNLKEPYDLITFMKQEERSEEVRSFEKILEYQKVEIERNEDKDPDLEQRFLKTDWDCKQAGIALTDIDLYTKTVMSLENKGVRAVDHIDLTLAHPKRFRKPNCTKLLNMPYSIHAYDHLQAVQERKNLSSVAEPDLIYLLPADEGLDRIGHLIYHALKKNKTSWVLYNFASYFWRVHGNAEQVIECARKALHFAPKIWKNVALLNMANALHRAHYSADAAVLGEAALEGGQDMEVIYFMLGNIYAALGQYSKSIERFQQALKLSPDLSVAEKRMYAVMCHQKLEAALEAQHRSLQRTLAELRDYQVKQEQLQELQQVVKKSRRNPDEQYESNLNFHHTKLLQGFTADSANCELTDVGSGAHLYVCKQDSYPQGEVFGQPLETAVIEAADMCQIHNNCIRLPNGEENCFNLSTGPFNQAGYNSYLSPPRHASTPPWQNAEWPSINECNEITGGMPDWFEFSPTHLAPENKGLNATPTVTDYLSLGKNYMMSLPWFSPVCVTVEPLQEGDTAMDYVEGIAQRTQLPLTDTLDSLKKQFLNYGVSDYINVDEMGHRVLTSLEENKEPKMKWMLYNLAGLYWQISGNNYHGVECFRRALRHTPIEHADIPLVNVASVMLRLQRPHDAIQLLRMALVVNSTEPTTHFTLGNALAAQKNFSQAIQQYKMALNFNPGYEKAQEALKITKCHQKQPDRLCPVENDAGKEYAHGVNTGHESGDVGKSMRSAEGNIQRESRTVCYHVDGKRECKTETRSRDNSDTPCAEGMEHKKERKGDKLEEKGEEKWKQRKTTEGAQRPPQAPTHGQMNGSGQMNTVEEPRKIIEKQIYNVRMLEPIGTGKRMMFDIKNMAPGMALNPAQGPHIPAAPAPGIDLSNILHNSKTLWPSADDCQHFKRLNLRAFYSTWLSVEAKDARIDDYIDFEEQLVESEMRVPFCWTVYSMYTMEHLKPMQYPDKLEYPAEQGLRDILLALSKHQDTMRSIGTRIAIALEKYPDSWVVYNIAALYWRVEGDAVKALNCLKVALHHAPRDMKDIALISMANIFHGSGWIDEGIIVAKQAVEIAPELVINHFTLANIYSSRGEFDKAIEYYQSTLALQSEFQPAIERLKTIQCNVLQWADMNMIDTPHSLKSSSKKNRK